MFSVPQLEQTKRIILLTVYHMISTIIFTIWYDIVQDILVPCKMLEKVPDSFLLLSPTPCLSSPKFPEELQCLWLPLSQCREESLYFLSNAYILVIRVVILPLVNTQPSIELVQHW